MSADPSNQQLLLGEGWQPPVVALSPSHTLFAIIAFCHNSNCGLILVPGVKERRKDSLALL